MAPIGKRMKTALTRVDHEQRYALEEAVGLAVELAKAKFDETMEIAIRLGVDPRQADQNVRGTVALPHGTGRSVRVAVFAKGEKEREAKEAGADVVGGEDLVKRIQDEGWLEFDSAVATPDMMGLVGRIGKVLGPRGLMPNPKVGTVTPDVVQAVKNAKAGQVQFRADKAGIVHATIGRASFDVDRLKTNLSALVDALNKVKPSSSKGIYLRKISVSSTMGIGVRVDAATLSGQ